MLICESCGEDLLDDDLEPTGQYTDGTDYWMCERCVGEALEGLEMAEAAAVRNIHE